MASGVTILTPLVGGVGGLGSALFWGGSGLAIWGWFAVSFFTLFEVLGMCELASAYPTAGGMYHWVYVLTESVWMSWTFGWMELLGQIASVCGVSVFFTQFAQATIILATTSSTDGGSKLLTNPGTAAGTLAGVATTQAELFAIYAGCTIGAAAINSCGPRVLRVVTDVMAWCCLAFLAVLIILIPAVAPTHQSAAWVFGDWDPTLAHLLGNAGGGGGLGPKWTPAYGAMLGLLFAAYTFTGYDGPAHMSEETKNAAVATPRGVLCGFLSCAISGWAFAIACCFSIKNAAPGVSTISGLESSTEAGHGYNAFSQILYDAFQNRYGNGQIGTALMALPLIGTWLCEVSILMYVARILFAYSRDDGVPFSRIWKQVHPVTKTPLNAVWGTALIAVAVGLTYLRSSFAINAILSLSVIALNVSYVTPVIIRCTVGRKRFRKGPWNLGVLAYPFCAIATLWVGFAVCVFSLPQAYPVTFQNLNYAGPCFGAVLFASQVYWFFPGKHGAHAWFKGPANEVHVQNWIADRNFDHKAVPLDASNHGNVEHEASRKNHEVPIVAAIV